MRSFPTVQDLSEGGESGDGHLWILEAVDGVPLRFELRPDGQLRFGNDDRPLDPPSIRPAVRPAIRAVRASFKRDQFRSSVGDVRAVTFFGIATLDEGTAYDWGRLPAFVGYDVYSAERDGLLPPDAAHAIFARLGLTPATALERERRADTFDPEGYEWTDSDWRDGPVTGVRLADKHGWRGTLDNPAVDRGPGKEFESAAAAASALVTAEILARAADDDPVEWVRNELARRHRCDLREAALDPAGSSFKSEIAKAVQRVETE